MKTEEIRQKALALRKIYGLKGMSDLLNVEQSVVSAVLTTNDDAAVSKVRSGVRRYWQSWMKSLTGTATVINVEKAKGNSQ